MYDGRHDDEGKRQYDEINQDNIFRETHDKRFEQNYNYKETFS